MTRSQCRTGPIDVAMVGVGNFGAYRRALMRKSGLFHIVAAYDLDAGNLASACAIRRWRMV